MKWLRQHKWTLIISVLLFLGITNCQNLDQSKHSLSYSSYQIPSDKIDTPIRILQLTDLHNSEFGEDNQELIDRIASQSPDLILLTGDLLNSGEPVTEIATNLISSLCEIAPVYLSLGNHEIEYQDNFGTDVTQLYQAAGAIVLEHQYRDITVKGQSLRIVTACRTNTWKRRKLILANACFYGILRIPTVTRSCLVIFRLPG